MRARPVALALLLALASVPFARAVPDKDAEEAIRAFKKSMATKDDKARGVAVKALAPVQHRWVAEALASPLEKDAATSVRVEAAKALGGQWAPKAVDVLVKSLAADEEIPGEVVVAIVDALGETESDAAVATLVELLVPAGHVFRNNAKAPASETATITAHAVAALRHAGSSKAVGNLVDFMGDETQARRGKDSLMTAAGAALTALTGEKLTGAKAWRDWWSANGESAKTLKVYRCLETGKTWDKVAADSHCPTCPDKANAKCSVFLKTRFEGATTAEEPTTKKK